MIRETRAWAALEFRGLNPSMEVDTALTVNGVRVADSAFWVGIDGVSIETVEEAGVFLARNHVTYVHREDVRDLAIDLLCHLATVKSDRQRAEHFVEAWVASERWQEEKQSRMPTSI